MYSHLRFLIKSQLSSPTCYLGKFFQLTIVCSDTLRRYIALALVVSSTIFDFFFHIWASAVKPAKIQNHGASFIRTPIIFREFYPNAAWSLWLVMKINPVNISLHLWIYVPNFSAQFYYPN